MGKAAKQPVGDVAQLRPEMTEILRHLPAGKREATTELAEAVKPARRLLERASNEQLLGLVRSWLAKDAARKLSDGRD